MLRSTVRRVRGFALSCILSAALAGPVSAATAPDFPPGVFSDGGRYSLADFEGKVVVLFFYEQNCPSCRNKIPDRNKVVDQFAGKPVKFFAVGPGDTLADISGYTRSTRLKMTSFSDLFGVMQSRYGMQISLQNIYQFRVIGPDGSIVARNIDMNPADIEKALAGAKWKYKDGGYDPRLNPILEGLEWGQYVPAVRALRPLTKGGNKTVQESANKLWDVLKTEAKAEMDEAAKAIETDPVKAHDVYTKVSAAFVNDDLGKEAAEALKTLKTNKAVVDEMAARRMFDQFNAAAARAQLKQKPAFVAQARMIAQKYPETPTGKRAAEFADELEKAEAQ